LLYVQDCFTSSLHPLPEKNPVEPRKAQNRAGPARVLGTKPSPATSLPARRSAMASCALRDTLFGHPVSVYTGPSKFLSRRLQVRGARRRSSRAAKPLTAKAPARTHAPKPSPATSLPPQRSAMASCALRNTLFGHPVSVYTGPSKILSRRLQVRGARRCNVKRRRPWGHVRGYPSMEAVRDDSPRTAVWTLLRAGVPRNTCGHRRNYRPKTDGISAGIPRGYIIVLRRSPSLCGSIPGSPSAPASSAVITAKPHPAGQIRRRMAPIDGLIGELIDGLSGTLDDSRPMRHRKGRYLRSSEQQSQQAPRANDRGDHGPASAGVRNAGGTRSPTAQGGFV